MYLLGANKNVSLSRVMLCVLRKWWYIFLWFITQNSFWKNRHISKWFALLRFSFSKSEVKPMMKNYLLLMYIDLTQRATQLEKVRVIDRWYRLILPECPRTRRRASSWHEQLRSCSRNFIIVTTVRTLAEWILLMKK